jgi:DNA-binding response OmpR family regulator
MTILAGQDSFCAHGMIAGMEKHILIVEDEADIREAIAESLTEAGFKVTTAENGKIGLELALKEKPDLILLDIVMPEMTGHQVLKKLREDPWGKDVKVVMLTSMESTLDVATAYEGMISDYIVKVHNSLDEIVKKVRVIVYQ